MRLLDRLIEKQTLIYQTEVENADYIVMDKNTIEELRRDYIDCYGDENPSWEDLQELAGARIVVPLIGSVNGGFKFSTGVGSVNRESVY